MGVAGSKIVGRTSVEAQAPSGGRWKIFLWTNWWTLSYICTNRSCVLCFFLNPSVFPVLLKDYQAYEFKPNQIISCFSRPYKKVLQQIVESYTTCIIFLKFYSFRLHLSRLIVTPANNVPLYMVVTIVYVRVVMYNCSIKANNIIKQSSH